MPNNEGTKALLSTIITLCVLLVVYLSSPWLYRYLAEPIGVSEEYFRGFMMGVIVALPLGMLILTYLYSDLSAAWLVTRDNGFVALLLLALPLGVILIPMLIQLGRLVFLALGPGWLSVSCGFVLLVVFGVIALLRKLL